VCLAAKSQESARERDHASQQKPARASAERVGQTAESARLSRRSFGAKAEASPRRRVPGPAQSGKCPNLQERAVSLQARSERACVPPSSHRSVPREGGSFPGGTSRSISAESHHRPDRPALHRGVAVLGCGLGWRLAARSPDRARRQPQTPLNHDLFTGFRFGQHAFKVRPTAAASTYLSRFFQGIYRKKWLGILLL
jgi:hypothetical protein